MRKPSWLEILLFLLINFYLFKILEQIFITKTIKGGINGI